jgi:hypothetical protein
MNMAVIIPDQNTKSNLDESDSNYTQTRTQTVMWMNITRPEHRQTVIWMNMAEIIPRSENRQLVIWMNMVVITPRPEHRQVTWMNMTDHNKGNNPDENGSNYTNTRTLTVMRMNMAVTTPRQEQRKE